MSFLQESSHRERQSFWNVEKRLEISSLKVYSTVLKSEPTALDEKCFRAASLIGFKNSFTAGSSNVISSLF